MGWVRAHISTGGGGGGVWDCDCDWDWDWEPCDYMWPYLKRAHDFTQNDTATTHNAL